MRRCRSPWHARLTAWCQVGRTAYYLRPIAKPAAMLHNRPMHKKKLIAAAVAGLVALSAVPRLAFSLAAVLLAGAVAGNVAGAAVGWSVAAVVAVALYRAQR